MSDNTDLVVNALEYYDKNNEKYKDFLKSIKYIKFKVEENDLEHNKIIMFDKNKKEIFTSRYEVIGLYSSVSNMWIWGWSLPQYKKNTTTIVRKLWNYGAELDVNSHFLKRELITSRFRISDPIQLEIHTAIATYLSKKPLIYKHTIKYDTVKDEDFVPVLDQNINKYNETSDYNTYYMFILDYDKIDI